MARKAKTEHKESMSVNEAGRRGGEATAETHDHKFYERIGQMGGEAGGKKGGQRERKLVDEGKDAEAKQEKLSKDWD